MKHQSAQQHSFSSSVTEGKKNISTHCHQKATQRTPNLRFKTNHSLRRQGKYPELCRMLAKLCYLQFLSFRETISNLNKDQKYK